MKKYISATVLILLLLPSLAFAQTSVKGLIKAVGGLIDMSIKILAGVAVLVFFWGLAKFIFRSGGDEKAVEGGKRVMKWGLIALFVMVSVWGIVKFIQRELNLIPPSMWV